MKQLISKEFKYHYRSIIKLGIPIIIGQIGIILVGIIDNVMVGRFATDDLAAASFVNSVFNIPIFMGLGFAYGLTPLAGQFFGQSNHSRLGSLLKNSLLLNFLFGLLLTGVMLLIWCNIDKLGQPSELVPLIKRYYMLHIVSIVFIMLFNGFKQFSDGVNDTKTPMYIMLSANALNIIFNFILIYGVDGVVQPLGVVGAGVATLISRVYMLIAFLIIFFTSPKFKTYRDSFVASRYNLPDSVELGRMGSMVSLQMGMETSLFSITGVMIGWIGTAELASHQILVAISTIGFMFYYGIGAAIAVKVSNYYGRGEYSNINLTAKAGSNIIMGAALMVSILLLIVRKDVALLFTSDQQIIDIVSIMVFTLITYQFGDALQITYANSLRGISDVVVMAAISFVGYFVIAIPVSYICGFVLNWGLQGVWIGYPVGLTLTGVAMWYRFNHIIKSKGCLLSGDLAS
ncbi:MAG: MATE family efflux transporter [Rikenellaceae bacterium]